MLNIDCNHRTQLLFMSHINIAQYLLMNVKSQKQPQLQQQQYQHQQQQQQKQKQKQQRIFLVLNKIAKSKQAY